MQKQFKTYPKVLRNPHTLPSANNDTTSPKWRKLAEPIIPSPIFHSPVVLVLSFFTDPIFIYLYILENKVEKYRFNSSGKTMKLTEKRLRRFGFFICSCFFLLRECFAYSRSGVFERERVKSQELFSVVLFSMGSILRSFFIFIGKEYSNLEDPIV